MPDNQLINFGSSGGSNSGDESVDESKLRNNIVQTALSWVGTLEGSSGHAEIIAIYNSKGPYPISTTSPWCAAFASAVAIQCGMEDIIPITPSCGNMISWFQQKGDWVENDTYHPTAGDFIFYIWNTGSDTVENMDGSDHVGIVISVGSNYFDVVEGNKLGHSYDDPPNVDRVGVRRVYFNSSYIRGFGVPSYGKKTDDGVQLAYEPVKYTPPKVVHWEDWIAENQVNWLRRYRFDAGFEGESGGFSIGEFNGPNNPPLRLAFNIEKGDYETQNNSTIRIWNLGKEHRDVLSTPNCYIYLYGGYGKLLPMLTQGMVARTIDTLEGGDLVTELEIVDIRRTIRDTYVRLSFQESINGKYIINKTVEAMGLKEDEWIGQNLRFMTYPNGFAFVGPALKALERVCIDSGYVCTILNGDINIHKRGEVTATRAIVLSAETGLIGNPRKLIETNNGAYYLRGWEVEFMLNGAIDLGSWIRLESPFIKEGFGYYEVVELRMTGDSMGDEWKCQAKLQDPNYGENPLYVPKDTGNSYVNTDSAWPD